MGKRGVLNDICCWKKIDHDSSSIKEDTFKCIFTVAYL